MVVAGVFVSCVMECAGLVVVMFVFDAKGAGHAQMHGKNRFRVDIDQDILRPSR